jgi:histone demethylase JARID1
VKPLACGKKHKAADKEKPFGSARARQKRAAAWVKRAKKALAQKTPPAPTVDLEAILMVRPPGYPEF